MIGVRCLGELVEQAPAEELLSNPIHPYTKALLSGTPIPEAGDEGRTILLKKKNGSGISSLNECCFVKRCMFAFDQCYTSRPGIKEVVPNHFVACHLTEE